jgi:DNA repair protein RecN (Recombination protein N)
MLKTIHIKNYAIIEDLKVDFHNGLSIITGETGAGKSILLGALGLVMGNRADGTVLFDKNSKCIVEVVYDISAYNLEAFFEEADIDYEKLCVIRREIVPSGKSRAFINDTPARLEILKTLSNYLVDLHQQFDAQDINEEEFQISALDALGNNQDLLHKYQSEYSRFKRVSNELSALETQSKNALQEADYIKFQLQEFEGLELYKGELEKLENDVKRLTGGEDIQRVGGFVNDVLSDSDTSVVNTIEGLLREISPLSSIDEKMENLRERLFSVLEELRDLASLGYSISENADYDEEKLAETEERLSLINRLLIKHQVKTDEDLMALELELIEKLESFENVDLSIAKLKAQKVAIENQLLELGKTLHNNRIKSGKKLEKEVNNMLHDLSMKNASIEVVINSVDHIRKHGLDEVKFLFSPNKGSSPLLLSKVASGGELSRLNLAIKSIIAGALTLPTLIFDEIDSGVSGQVSMMMGSILKNLSQKHQTICITHSPQIASKADVHYHISKVDRGERTYTLVNKLTSEERKFEIAKMLSGDPPSAEAISNAQQLLESYT